MTRYVATINTPGYLPWDDDPPVFDTPSEAWWYLYHERCNAESDSDTCANCGEKLTPENWQDHDDDSDTGRELARMAKADFGADAFDHAVIWNGTGTIYGDTPGYDGDHDLGLAYSVSVTEEEEEV